MCASTPGKDSADIFNQVSGIGCRAYFEFIVYYSSDPLYFFVCVSRH